MARLICPECGADVVEGDVVCRNPDCAIPLVGFTRPIEAPEADPTPTPTSASTPTSTSTPKPAPEPSSSYDGSGPAASTATPRPTTVDRAGVLELRFPGGSIVVRPGREVTLGRDPEECPFTAARLAPYDNISRRHATVGLDPDGTGWVRDDNSTNGTFVDGREIDPGARGPLRDGAELRLASDVVAQVLRRPADPGGGG